MSVQCNWAISGPSSILTNGSHFFTPQTPFIKLFYVVVVVVVALISIWNYHICFLSFVSSSLVCKFFWTVTLFFFTTTYLAENSTWHFVRNQFMFVKWMMKQNLYTLQFALILSVVANGVCTFVLFLRVGREKCIKKRPGLSAFLHRLEKYLVIPMTMKKACS